jgi:hypothetical protein
MNLMVNINSVTYLVMKSKLSRAEQNRLKVKAWRRNTKQRIFLSMGAKCQCCGYNRCHDALELHHVDPKTKEFEVGDIRANPVSWARIVTELRKCVMLCAICHREVHAGIREIAIGSTTFNEAYADKNSTAYKMAPAACLEQAFDRV